MWLMNENEKGERERDKERLEKRVEMFDNFGIGTHSSRNRSNAAPLQIDKQVTLSRKSPHFFHSCCCCCVKVYSKACDCVCRDYTLRAK